MPALSTLARRDPAAELRDALLRGLREGRWRSGERLPTERELAQHFGLGRTAVRRVLSELRNAGLIHQTVGSGTYVNDDALGRLRPTTAEPISPVELMEARRQIEPMLAELIVTHGTAADFEAMEAVCERAEAAATLAEYTQWNAALHQQLAAATHNAFFAAMYVLVQDAHEHSGWARLKEISLTDQHRQQYQRDHRGIVSALKQRDVALARRRTIEHLDRVARHVLRAEQP